MNPTHPITVHHKGHPTSVAVVPHLQAPFVTFVNLFRCPSPPHKMSNHVYTTLYVLPLRCYTSNVREETALFLYRNLREPSVPTRHTTFRRYLYHSRQELSPYAPARLEKKYHVHHITQGQMAHLNLL